MGKALQHKLLPATADDGAAEPQRQFPMFQHVVLIHDHDHEKVRMVY